MRILRQFVTIYLALTALTGVAYPLAVTAASQLLFSDRANGSLVIDKGEVRGSRLIGQDFTSPVYFQPRPSMTDYGTLPSGASNLGPTSGLLRQAIENRERELALDIPGPIPVDLLTASASGLDPHISPEAAFAQVGHVARARGLSADQEASLIELVMQHVEGPQWHVFGAPRVNVLELNLATDDMFGRPLAEGAERN
jgi:K+-transporting ATPase ATPase C chain